jgi:hypothetical protein
LAWLVGGQATTPVQLPGDLRAHVKGERFQIVTSVRGLPLGVRDGMRMLWGSQTLDIADPGAEFQATGNADPNLLSRRLVAAGCSSDHCLVYYQLGGRATSWRIVLFHWTPSATRFEWGGTAPRGLAKIEDVLNAVLSGIIEGPTTAW